MWWEGRATVSRVKRGYFLPAVVDDAQQAVLGEVAEGVHESSEELLVVLHTTPSVVVRVGVACSPKLQGKKLVASRSSIRSTVSTWGKATRSAASEAAFHGLVR